MGAFAFWGCPLAITPAVLSLAQARQLIAGLQLALEARHHLQDQMVTGLVTEGVIGVAKVVQVQVRQQQQLTTASSSSTTSS